MPRGTSATVTLVIASQGSAKVDFWPQYSAGWALKICNPLISSRLITSTFSQWVNRVTIV